MYKRLLRIYKELLTGRRPIWYLSVTLVAAVANAQNSDAAFILITEKIQDFHATQIF